jgi:hypothetical protein
MGAALAAIPWIGEVSAANSPSSLFPTGSAKVDDALVGGLRAGTLLVVLGPDGDGKSGFLLRMAEVNGVTQMHAMNSGNSDMLSLMQRPDGQRTGCLVLNGPEPATDKEHADMQRDPNARNTFLTRWFTRARDVVRESGGIMAIRVQAAPDMTTGWISIPDYVVCADERVLKPA